ncbi:uncharacterized protein LOC109604720 isoform X3 [Aethina tumida]|uniref:uncharacterized protein LOC109604720 isoform X3 n=1 Tax=Aethina tumida TaxID=116153 RepID=UPI002148954B|nr:uncharacterized protein LOC109604720 isoform X3 [Aethina tumida]
MNFFTFIHHYFDNRSKSISGSTIPTNDTNSLDGFERGEKTQLRGHQVHPVLDSQVLVCYEKQGVQERETTPPAPQNCYPLVPNICVEAGRIQFINQEQQDGGNGALALNDVSPTGGRVTVTRGQQTDEDEDQKAAEAENKEIQTFLESRIAELESVLEEAQKRDLRYRQTIRKLQKQLEKRESAKKDADRERLLHAESENRTKQALLEAARCRSRLKLLTSEFARMEETVRSMLAYKKQVEQLKQEKAAITLAYENRCQQYQNTINRLNAEISNLREQLEDMAREKNPDGIINSQTMALQRHAEEARKQYERCLDDVANQVVKALLAQKGLKEEVGTLNMKIKELENQNRALTSILVHQLRGEASAGDQDVADGTEIVISPENGRHTSLKHCNSFNSEVLDEQPVREDQCDTLKNLSENNLKALSYEVMDTRLSLADKKRHQVLTKLWTELKGTEITPKKLIEALNNVDSALWVPPKRPVSLNLHLPIFQANKSRRIRPVLAQSVSKSEEENTGSESPESGNRDEGYSTMSSDVQDMNRGVTDTTLPRMCLEDLKEASDEADQENRLLMPENEPDIFYIPFNLLKFSQRNSFPPGKDILPFQHAMRSFSDSHLCIKITTAPTPCYTFSSPISSSPSILLLDISEKPMNPLRRTRCTSNLWGFSGLEKTDDKASQLSWYSTDDQLECTNWDSDYIQHWLRLDETRSTAQQQHRDMLELEYDNAELEDWSLSLSSDDLREQWKKEATTPGQLSVSTLPSIQENNALELEEDNNECLWNNSSYMVDKEGRELVTLLMDTHSGETQWPYVVSTQQVSPDNSWSSGSDCNSFEPDTCSKRSSAALSGSSDDTGELPGVGTDFTRDFYRLVKFESTKSLASTSSRSLVGTLSENGDREATLQNVLSFIAEQTKQELKSRPCSSNDITKEFNIEGPAQIFGEMKISDSEYSIPKSDSKSSNNENYVTLKQLCEEFTHKKEETVNETIKQNITYAEEICLVTPLDVESENCSNIGEHPVDICSSVNVELSNVDYQEGVTCEDDKVSTALTTSDVCDTYSDLSLNTTSESMTSSVSTPDTIVSKIPRRKTNVSRIPVSPSRINHNKENVQESNIPKSKVQHKFARPKLKKIVHVQQQSPPQHVITSERLPQSTSGVLSNIIEGPPHRAVSFHERATSKDVIDELNRMIKNGDEPQETTDKTVTDRLDQACRPTGWVHLENDIDLEDPKARANILDSMMTSVSSDSSPTSSCGGSIASDSVEEPPAYSQLHQIHKYHRQKKANATRPELVVVRANVGGIRPTIIGRSDFFVRYGEKEREAVASFDFLNELSGSTSASNDDDLV